MSVESADIADITRGAVLALHPFDIAVLVWVLLVVFAVAFAFRRKAAKSFDDFFLSGRRLPWWLLGTSMVATTFAADTPLAVTELVQSQGIAGNWLWWSFLFGTTATVWFFADNWRRAAIASDVELCALRYGGVAGQGLRAFRAGYMSLVYVGIVLGWVLQAMATVLRVSLGLGGEAQAVLLLALALMALAYTLISGLWGVVATDLLQFVLAMSGAIILACFAWDDMGGAEGLRQGLVERLGEAHGTQLLSFFPSDLQALGGFGLGWMLWIFAAQWWSVVYPGNEPGGGSFVAQRMLAARSVEDARKGTLLYAVAHYAIRPWPWIIVALWTLLAFDPELVNARDAYPAAMQRLLPTGLFGLLLASFFAAFMSTVDTLLTLAGSYLINDFYRPFLARGRSERHYLLVSRLAIVLTLVAGLFFGFRLGDGGISSAWRILLALGAGSGLVLMLRWYWWRINAWSEISAMLAAFASALCFDPNLREVMGSPSWLPEGWIVYAAGANPKGDSAARMFAIVACTTAIWILVTLLTRPTQAARLDAFYRRVLPSGFWGPVAARCPDLRIPARMGSALLAYCLSTGFVLGLLFAIGEGLLGTRSASWAWASAALFCALLLWGRGAASQERS